MSDDPVRLVTDLYDAYTHGDLDRIRPVIASDFVMEQPDGLPWSGRYHGPDGFFEFLGKLLGHLDTTLEIEQIFDAGGTVVQVGHTVGTVHATGRAFRSREIHTLVLREGRLVRFTVFVDVPVMLAALGAGEAASR